MKNIMCLALTLQMMGGSALAGSKKEITAYKKSSRTKYASQFRLESRRLTQAQRHSLKLQEQFKALLDKAAPGLHKKLSKQASLVLASKLTPELKSRRMRLILAPHRTVIQKALRKIQVDQRAYTRKIARTLRLKKGTTKQLANYGIAHIAHHAPSPLPNGEIHLTPPYQFKDTHKLGVLVAGGEIRVNEETGQWRINSLSPYAGGIGMKAAMGSVFSVPAGVSSVQAEAIVESDFYIIVSGLLGLAGAGLTTFVEVVRNGQTLCQAEHSLSFLIAPLLAFFIDDRETVSTLSCEFTPSSHGGDYVIAAGAKTHNYGAVVGVSAINAHGDIPSMTLNFR